MGVIHESDVSMVVTSLGGSFHTASQWIKRSGIDCDSVIGMEEPRLASVSTWLLSSLGIWEMLNSLKVNYKVFTCSR